MAGCLQPGQPSPAACASYAHATPQTQPSMVRNPVRYGWGQVAQPAVQPTEGVRVHTYGAVAAVTAPTTTAWHSITAPPLQHLLNHTTSTHRPSLILPCLCLCRVCGWCVHPAILPPQTNNRRHAHVICCSPGALYHRGAAVQDNVNQGCSNTHGHRRWVAATASIRASSQVLTS